MSESAQIIRVDTASNWVFPFHTGRIAATFPLDVAENRKRVHNALHGAKLSLKDNVGKTIPLVDAITCPREKDLDNGEIDEWTEVVLMTETGEMYSTGSPFVADSIASILSLCGPTPWPLPVMVTICKRKTRKDREMLYLEMA